MNYNTLASADSVEKTTKNLMEKGYNVYGVANKSDALAKIKEIIPEGISVMNGSSVTLEEIGYIDLLKSGDHKWNNMHGAIVAEKDPVKQSKIRSESSLSDYYVGSVHALTEEGDLVIASNTGSQMPNIVFNSKHLVFVVGTQKLVPDINEAFKRLESYVIPLEDKHMQGLYGVGTKLNKVLIFKGESPMIGRSVEIILVNDILGF